MLTERVPESPEHGLGRYVGIDGVAGAVQGLPETPSATAPVSSTVAWARQAVKMIIIVIEIICLFMLTPLIKL
jgi:hypothetical protein